MPFTLPTTPCIEIPLDYRHKTGYAQISITDEDTGRRRKVYVHRRIVERQVGRRLTRSDEVMHLCDNKACFRADHLLLGTHDENMAMAAERGQINRGESNRAALLTETQVLEIRARPSDRAAVLAEEYGVKIWTIWHIRARRSWRHLP